MLFVLIGLLGCAASEKTDTVSISGFHLLIISDLSTDSVMSAPGNVVEAEFPVEGIPIAGAWQQGGIMSANNVNIRAASGGTIVIERGLSGNVGVNVPEALERMYKATSHPFGNITVDGGSAMREHIDD